MSTHHRHLKRLHLATWHILIALLGFLFALEMLRAHQMSAYLGEEARLLDERAKSVQASGSVR